MSAGTFEATAYGPPWDAMQGTGTTATGVQLPAGPTNEIIPIVAVDPSVIPLGSKLKIWPNPFGDRNLVFTAADTGGAIQGNHIDFLDLFGRGSQDAWGRRPVSVSVIGKGSTSKVSAVSVGAGTPTSSSPSTSPTSSSSGQPSDWLKLLLDATFVAFGAAAVYKGSRRMMSGSAA